MEPISLMENIQIWISLAVLLAQGVVVYWVWQRRKIDSRYGKAWGRAWWFFFVAMAICFLRRASIVAYSFGMDGRTFETLTWVDRYISNDILTILYLIFLLSLSQWWKGFYGGMDKLIGGEEVDRVDVEEPNGVLVDEPTKVIVGLDDKRVTVERPKKVMVTKPKKVDIVKKKKE